jgi:hypothetical protein
MNYHKSTSRHLNKCQEATKRHTHPYNLFKTFEGEDENKEQRVSCMYACLEKKSSPFYMKMSSKQSKRVYFRSSSDNKKKDGWMEVNEHTRIIHFNDKVMKWSSFFSLASFSFAVAPSLIGVFTYTHTHIVYVKHTGCGIKWNKERKEERNETLCASSNICLQSTLRRVDDKLLHFMKRS